MCRITQTGCRLYVAPTKRGNGGSMSETGVTSHELNWEVTTGFHSFSLTKVRHNPNGVDEAYDT